MDSPTQTRHQPLPLQTTIFKFISHRLYYRELTDNIDDILDHIAKLPLPKITQHYLARFLLLTTHIHPEYYTAPSHFIAAKPI